MFGLWSLVRRQYDKLAVDIPTCHALRRIYDMCVDVWLLGVIAPKLYENVAVDIRPCRSFHQKSGR